MDEDEGGEDEDDNGDGEGHEEDDEEKWIRHWFVLKNSFLALFSEAQKLANDLSQPMVQLATKDMKSAARAKGVDFYKWGIVLETLHGDLIRMRAVGQSEMKQLLSTLNVHCIETVEEDGAVMARDWANDLIDALAARQKDNGSFENVHDRWMEGDPVLVTAYALLALQHAIN